MGRYDTNQNGQNEGVVLVSSLYSKVDGSGGVTHETETVKRASQSHMRPYQPPKRKDEQMKQLCSAENCKAYPMKDTGYCAGHSRSLGLKKWPKGGHPKVGGPHEAQ